jgi:hypothetical protein
MRRKTMDLARINPIHFKKVGFNPKFYATHNVLACQERKILVIMIIAPRNGETLVFGN